VALRLARFAERALRSPLGAALERREMAYRIRKRIRHGSGGGEAAYGVDWYKEHVSGHQERILTAFSDRVATP
jgi:hypothetical protein